MADVANKTLTSRVAAVAAPLRTQLEKAERTWGIRALQVSAFAVTLIPIIGLGVSYFIDRQKNSTVADNKQEVLAKYFRKQVAAQLSMKPEDVRGKDLTLAAKVNPKAFGPAIAKVQAELDNANRSATFATGGAMALSSLVPLPGVGTIAHTASKVAVDVTGAIAGSAVASVFEKDLLHTQEMLEHLNEKRSKGEQITAADIVMLRISQNEKLQEELKKKNGVAFHKMDEAGQQTVIASMADMGDAQVMADKINTGQISEQDVLMVEQPAPGRWASRVGGPRGGQRTSFVSQVNAQRAATAQGVAGGIA